MTTTENTTVDDFELEVTVKLTIPGEAIPPLFMDNREALADLVLGAGARCGTAVAEPIDELDVPYSLTVDIDLDGGVEVTVTVDEPVEPPA